MLHRLGGLGVTSFAEALLLAWGGQGVHEVFSRSIVPRHDEAVQHSYFWYDVVRRATGKAVLVDASKDARRLKSLYLHRPDSFRLIHLVRDGRAVAASAMRRLGVTMARAAAEWKRTDQHCSLAASTIPADQQTLVRYEDLCTQPQATLDSLCRFLGVAFEPRMLEVRRKEAHSLGGNPMRYRVDETGITLDQRWKAQLNPSDLMTFDKVAGGWNRRRGYT